VCPGPFNKAQQFAADGRRTPFPWLLRRHSKVAAVLSVSGWGLGPFGCGVPVALVPGQVAKRENWSAPRPSESVSGLVASATGGVGSGFGIRRVGLSAENSVWICYF
tara:strand:+ start:877 stop:1197 length:321 start_codon:yes stop_codon:yes gene_type:complete